MLTNIIQNLVNRLKRQKTHTALLLITIALGLVFFMCIISFIDLMTGDIDPEPNRTRTLYLKESMYIKDGKSIHRNYPGDGDGFTTSFLNRYIKTLEKPEKIGIYKVDRGGLAFGEAWKRQHFSGVATDSDFLQIISLDFIYGKAFSANQVANHEPMVIIDTEMSKYLFGTTAAVGKTFHTGGGINRELKVAGVYSPISQLSEFEADYFLPYNMENFAENKKDESGYYNRGYYKALAMTKNRKDFPQIQAELKKVITSINATGSVEEFEGVQTKFYDTYYNLLVRTQLRYAKRLQVVMTTVLLVLILITPIFTLILINLTMIRERYQEIGIRRSFGSPRIQLINQILLENLIVTILGGIVGIILSFLVFDFL